MLIALSIIVSLKGDHVTVWGLYLLKLRLMNTLNTLMNLQVWPIPTASFAGALSPTERRCWLKLKSKGSRWGG